VTLVRYPEVFGKKFPHYLKLRVVVVVDAATVALENEIRA
jgi:hypothetical protein